MVLYKLCYRNNPTFYAERSIWICLLAAGHYFLQLAEETEICIIDLETELLEELASSRKEFKTLVDLAIGNSPKAKTLLLLKMNYFVHQILDDMRQCKQSGGNLLMELKTASLQLMNLYRKTLNEDKKIKKFIGKIFR